MRNRFTSGMIAGSLVGATIGMFAYERMTTKQKKDFMKNGSKMMKNASSLLNDFSVVRVLK